MSDTKRYTKTTTLVGHWYDPVEYARPEGILDDLNELVHLGVQLIPDEAKPPVYSYGPSGTFTVTVTFEPSENKEKK